MTIEKKTAEQHEIIIEDLNTDIKKLNEFFEYTQETKIDAEVKRDILNRVNKEIEWLEQIKDEEQESLEFESLRDEINDYHIEEWENNIL